MNPSPWPWRWSPASSDVSGRYLIDADGETVFSTKSDDAALVQCAPEMRDMLLKLEWEGCDFGATMCPICKGRNARHEPGCALAALLERAR